MSLGRDRRLAAGLAIGVSLLTLLPFVLARQIAPPEWVFSGFLLNPYDGFSYLAKMRQGLDGSWQFVLPYATDAGRPTFLFVFYLALGHIARLARLPLGTVFHGFRILSGTLMYLSIYALLERLPLARAARWCAYGLALGVGGLGWATVVVGFMASDLLIPESIPWLSTLVNPHFPLAAAALTIGLVAAVGTSSPWRAALLAGSAGLLLGMIQPFILATLWGVLGAWVVLEFGLHRHSPEAARWMRQGLIALAASMLAGLPWAVYDYWMVTSHPVLKAWSLQNLTPSPSPIAYLVGFAPLLVWAVVAVIQARPFREPSLRLIATWIVIGFLVLYLPFGLQRRLSLGLAIPLATLAGIGIDRTCRTPASRRLSLIATLVLSLPSLLLVVGAGVSSAATPGSVNLLSESEVAAYEWMAENLPEQSLILADERAGNRIPAWMRARVVAGHPFETPDAEAEEAWIARAFGWRGDPTSGLALLNARGIDYVYYGREERKLGSPTWLALLEPLFTSTEVGVYPVTP